MPGLPTLAWSEAMQQDPGWTWVDPLQRMARPAKSKSSRCYQLAAGEAQQGNDFDELLAESEEEERKLGELYRLRAENARLLAVINQPAPRPLRATNEPPFRDHRYFRPRWYQPGPEPARLPSFPPAPLPPRVRTTAACAGF